MLNQKTYKKIAEAAIALEAYVREDMWIPIGLDGYVTTGLIDFVEYVYGIPRYPFVENIVNASSKTGEFDKKKFNEVLSRPMTGNAICFLDMRTKTGNLGKILRSEIDEWIDKNHFIDAYYAVLFDPNKKADFGASCNEISDTERLNWLDSKDHVKMLIGKNDNGEFHYNLSSETKNSFNHIHGIEHEIMKIFDDDSEREMKKLEDMIKHRRL